MIYALRESYDRSGSLVPPEVVRVEAEVRGMVYLVDARGGEHQYFSSVFHRYYEPVTVEMVHAWVEGSR